MLLVPFHLAPPLIKPFDRTALDLHASQQMQSMRVSAELKRPAPPVRRRNPALTSTSLGGSNCAAYPFSSWARGRSLATAERCRSSSTRKQSPWQGHRVLVLDETPHTLTSANIYTKRTVKKVFRHQSHAPIRADHKSSPPWRTAPAHHDPELKHRA